MVHELEKGVQVVPTIRGQSRRGLSGETGFEQTAPTPGLYVERRPVIDAAAPEPWGMVDSHVLLVSTGAGGLTGSRALGKNASHRDTNIAVTLSTTSSSGTPVQTVALGSGSRTVVVGSSVCAASAGVHAVLVVPHYHESAGLAVAFAVSAVALAMSAVALALDAGPNVTTMIALLLVGVAVAYALSRTTGIPGLTVHPEPLDAFGTVVSCVELMAAWALVRPATRRSRS
jgi:hypothetical protein